MDLNLTDLKHQIELRRDVCKRARLSRDARFDGLFFTAVKTTGIYCRPICPANPPLDKNVDYYPSSMAAALSGYRPCLRCRPDSAPQSSAWLGTQTTFQRALLLVQQGELQRSTIENLASRLGISSRYLRQLFENNLGVSPKKYAIHQQCLFAKKLLHETRLPITHIAFAAGFNSIRRFNEAMQQQLRLSPREIRSNDKPSLNQIELKLHYRPPFAWLHCQKFLEKRIIPNLEWVKNNAYSRTFRYADSVGYFRVRNSVEHNCLIANIEIDNHRHLHSVTQRIRRMFDVDAPIDRIDQQLKPDLPKGINYLPGLRIPGVWSRFETGIRAILGQQVSVAQAKNLVAALVENLGDDLILQGQPARKLFPEPMQVCNDPLEFLRMPQARKDTVRTFAAYFASENVSDDLNEWQTLKGIGPWTINYVKLRSAKDPDVWLAADAGIKNALKQLNCELDIEKAKPWRSYLTFQLWNQLD
ncbi:MAG: helix-turn-helix domain-containing protein [Acidiferrobacterales bacterium]|nr:helix-turn-helix domain-containing protein [Acidiferrobacterales bacterium]